MFGRTVEVGIAFAAVQCNVVGLPLAAVRTLQPCWIVVGADGAWVVGIPGFFVDDRLVNVFVGEVAVPLMVRLGSWIYAGSVA